VVVVEEEQKPWGYLVEVEKMPEVFEALPWSN